jgi:hypothetical protein
VSIHEYYISIMAAENPHLVGHKDVDRETPFPVCSLACLLLDLGWIDHHTPQRKSRAILTIFFFFLEYVTHLPVSVLLALAAAYRPPRALICISASTMENVSYGYSSSLHFDREEEKISFPSYTSLISLNGQSYSLACSSCPQPLCCCRGNSTQTHIHTDT